MNLFEDTNPKVLKELLQDVHSNVMVLPQFQRDFVWEPAATQELIISIASNYPAGSLLRVRDKKMAFAVREFEGAPSLNGTKHTFLVLDGQQRLTSLYQAFYGVGEHRYYLDVRKLIEGCEFEEAIFHKRSSVKWVKWMEGFEAQAQEFILPLSVLKGGSGGFLAWLLQMTNNMLPEDRLAMQDSLMQINEKWIKTIDDYTFPVVTLSDNTEVDALCTIFETLNRTGVKLSVFELLTARFWSEGINLRALWDATNDQYPIIREYDVDPYYLLQAIALVSRSAPSCKRSDILDLHAEDINNWWHAITRSLAKGLEILRDDCHVMLAKWLPYQTMVVPLAAMLAKVGVTSTPVAGLHRSKIHQWFWCAVFGQAYESGANTQAAKDYSEMVAWMNGGDKPAVVRNITFDHHSLREITPRQRAIYRGTMCLVLGANGGARDFHTHAFITATLIAKEGIDDHHIFPANYLSTERKDISSRRRDCVLNRALIDRSTNQQISDNAPSDYLTAIRDCVGDKLDEILESHCIPSGTGSPLWRNDFDSFLEWREERIWREIQKVTGLLQSAEIEEVDELQ